VKDELPFVWPIVVTISMWGISDLAASKRKMEARLKNLHDVVFQNRKQFGKALGLGMKGIVPRGVETEDVIVVFVGVETPFLLRPVSGGYHIVDEAFVKECIKGGISGKEQRIFILC
jgi:hypothetical protein